jgi:hypothetical protein
MPSHVFETKCGIPCALRRMSTRGPLAAVAAAGAASAIVAIVAIASATAARRAECPLVPGIGGQEYDLCVARVAQATFLVVGFTFVIGYGIGYLTGFHGFAWDIAGAVVYVVAGLTLPFMGLASLVWLVVDSVRKFRRCRAARTA